MTSTTEVQILISFGLFLPVHKKSCCITTTFLSIVKPIEYKVGFKKINFSKC